MRALILVDIQNDFMPGGPLGVPGGREIIPLAQALIPIFDLVVATQDWHPADHGSFATHHPDHSPGDVIELHGLAQVLWPVHCVQQTDGAQLVEGLDPESLDAIFVKGTDSRIDSYSGFFDNGRRKSTGLEEWLKIRSVQSVTVLGVATDYCIKSTALDAVSCGFQTILVEDAVRAVDLAPGDGRRAVEEMRAAGIEGVQSGSLLARAAQL
jgi:nicotinamidase/pyrazinamidase